MTIWQAAVRSVGILLVSAVQSPRCASVLGAKQFPSVRNPTGFGESVLQLKSTVTYSRDPSAARVGHLCNCVKESTLGDQRDRNRSWQS